MNRFDAEKMARQLMAEHGLRDWYFWWDRAKRRFGCCHYRRKLITLSLPLTEAEPDKGRVRNTILHEIAHALVGPEHGHNRVWRSKAISIGCNGQRCGRSEVKLQAPFVGTCPACGHTIERFKRGNLFHIPCRRKGLDAMLRWRRNP